MQNLQALIHSLKKKKKKNMESKIFALNVILLNDKRILFYFTNIFPFRLTSQARFVSLVTLYMVGKNDRVIVQNFK